MVSGAVAEAAPVTWDFIETGCIAASGTCLPSPSLPLLLASLALPGETSSGTATYQALILPATETHSGDSFSLTLYNADHPGGILQIPNIISPPGDPIFSYDVSWKETAGHLDFASINVQASHDGISPDAGGYDIGTDNTFANCRIGQCMITGFWQAEPMAAPEPGTLTLLAGAGIVFLPLRRRARNVPNVLNASMS
jgi:hypothetical protein